MSEQATTRSTYLRERLLDLRRERMVAVFGCFVVLVTAIALMLPALSMTRGDLVCSLEEHAHSASCYEKVLVCGQEEGEGADPETGEGGHVHTKDCYEKKLVCEIPEHKHSDACYEQVEDEGEGSASGTASDGSAADSGDGSEGADGANDVGADGANDSDGGQAAGDGEPSGSASSVGTVEADSDSDMPAQSFKADLKDAKGKVTLTVEVEAPEGAFPAGTFMKIDGVDASDIEGAVEKAVAKKADGKVTQIQAVDIAFHKGGAEGAEIEPARDITVKLTSKLIAENEKPLVVHVDDKGKADVVDTLTKKQLKKRDLKAKDDQLLFDSDKFSTYGIVITSLEQTLTASDGNAYKVTATCPPEAGIPADAELAVSEIGDASELYGEYVAKTESALGIKEGEAGYIRLFDISIVDKSGNKIQPAAGVAVDVSIELADKDSNNDAAKSTKVVHFADDNASGEVVENSTDGQIVSFEANGFSIYAIVDSSKRLQYNFYDGTSLLVSEYIKKQDNVLQELYDPGVEPEYGQTFVGWAYAPNETNPSNIYTIEQLNNQAADKYNNATEELTVINVYAIYDEAWYLRYMDPEAEGSDTVLHVVRKRKDDPDKNVTIDYTYTPEEGVVFEGWIDVTETDTNTGQAKKYQLGDTLTLDHHVDLYVKLQGRNWLVFDSNAGGPGSGATYTPPQLLIGSDAKTSKPGDPTRRGYSFTGWNTKPDGTGEWWYKPDNSVNQFGGSLSKDTTLYARWEPNDTDYYVVFWKQKATDAAGLADGAKTYDYVSSERRSEKTGETVSTTNEDKQKGGTANSEYGYYFAYNENNSDTTATVDANGTTVLNVYYDRREITYSFTSNTYFTVPSYTGVVDGETVTLTPDGSGGYTYQVAETVDSYGWRYTDRRGRTYELPSNYINGTFYSQKGTDGYPNTGTASAYTQNNLPPDDDATQYYCYDTYDRRFYAIEKFVSGTTTNYISMLYTGDVSIGTTQTRSASYKGLYGSTFSSWPNPGNRRVWQYGGYNFPLALTVYDPLAAYNGNNPASFTETTITFTATNYSSGNTLYIYVQTEDGSWNYTDDYLLTTASIGANSTWYPTETFKGFTISGYQIGLTLNGSGVWTPITTTGSIRYNNENVYLRYARNQHNIHFISQGNHVTGRTEEIVEGVYYDSDLSKYAEGGSAYYEPTNGNEGYYFAGWYADPDCQVPFDFNTKMPDSNITVYAKWDTYRVRVVLVPTPNNEHNDEVQFANNQALSFRMDYNEEISDTNISSSVAKRAGYKLIGWYYSPDFNPATEIHFPLAVNKDTPGVDMNYQNGEDWNKYGDNDGSHDNVRGILKLYAKWELNVDENSVYVEYDVDDVYRTYDTAGMLQTTIPVDDNKYALTSDNVTFQVAEAPTEYTSGFEFYRWVLLNPDGSESDIQYNPADMASEIPSRFIYEETITDDLGNTATIKKIRLKAKFNIEADKVTTVTYDGNGGVTNDSAQQASVTESYPINKDFSMKDSDSFVREGYTLLGWAFKRQDGSKISVQAFKNAVNEMNADERIRAGIYTLGQKVAADNLKVSDENNWDPLENTVYAVWEPHKFTVTVKKLVEGENITDKEFAFTVSASEGYAIADDDASFKLVHDGQKTIANVPYGTELTINETPCAGFAVKSVDAKRVSDANGEPLGQPENLKGRDGKTYEVNGNIEITYTNKKATAPIKVLKIDQEGKPLEGAGFTISGEGVNVNAISTIRTIGEGEQAVREALIYENAALPIGTYSFTETSAPSGYNMLAESVVVTVGENGVTVTGVEAEHVKLDHDTGLYTIEIMNESGVALPNTGGMGTLPLTLFGSLLIVGAAAFLVARRNPLAALSREWSYITARQVMGKRVYERKGFTRIVVSRKNSRMK